MKRAGDEPIPSVQRAPKVPKKKTVTFSLPGRKRSPPTPLPNSSSASCSKRSRPSSSSSSSPPSSSSSSATIPTMTGHHHNHRIIATDDVVVSNNPPVPSSSRSRTAATTSSILRSTSNSSSTTTTAASPRFTFDFVDDASFGCSASTVNSASASNNNNNNNNNSNNNNSGKYSSPTHAQRAGRQMAGLSPSRLDARYMSRLPPSYSPRHHHNHQHPHSPHSDGMEIRRNLFGGSSLNSDESSTTTTGPQQQQQPVTPRSHQQQQRDRLSCSERIPRQQCVTPRSHDRLSFSQRSRSSLRRTSTTSTSSPRSATGGWGLPPTSPAHRSSSVTGAPSSVSSSSRSVSTFFASSPRKQGRVTGVASPLSGNLSRCASVSSSVASSPNNSLAGDNGSVADFRERAGAGDRFIPSRALSNFDFELGVASAGSLRGRDASSRSAFDGNGGSAGGAAMDEGHRGPLEPAPSFGATLMGAPPPRTDPGRDAAADDDGQQPAVASTFSDDAASHDEGSERHDATNRQPLLYDALLRSEMLGENVDPSVHSAQGPGNGVQGGSAGGNGNGNNNVGGGGSPTRTATPFRERSNNLRFTPDHRGRQFYRGTVYGNNVNENFDDPHSSIVNSFGLSPVSNSPHRRTPLGSYTERCKRKIAKVPTKVLDAPALQDDFYLNLVDWSSQNVLAVGLGSCVYLWSAATSRVTQLCDLSPTEDAVTSVAWSEGGRHLAVGSTRGDVQIWDAPSQKLVRTMTGHAARVGALSWRLSSSGGSPGSGCGSASSGLLASGSRDRLIRLRDPRSDGNACEMRLCGHKQEVCGLRWSFDERGMLASGGNDNKLLVWDARRHARPLHTFADHTAAVKAIAWSPHQHGLLASGGGTADRCIRFWNCLTGHGISCVDTGSQVCNLAFSKNCNELVSTHGYSLNQIVVWKYPSMQKIATLTGHTYRVLYLALSPDGSTIVTGAGDETLRFWQVFPGPQKENKAGGLLFPAGMPGSVIR